MDKNDRGWALAAVGAVALIMLSSGSCERTVRIAKYDAQVQIAEEINKGLTNVARAIAGICVE